MNALILPTATADRSIVKSANIPLPVGLPPFFFRDEFAFEIEFLETPTWFEDSSVVVSLTIGTFEDGQLMSPAVGVKLENGYVFQIDLDTTEFDQFISGNISKSAKLEIQVEGDTFSKTLVQKNVLAFNRIGEAILIELEEPIEPTIDDAEVISPPNAPSNVNLKSSPKPVSSVQVGRFGFAPSFVRAGNFSNPPSLKPSLVVAIVPPVAPAKPYWVTRILRDAPPAPVNVQVVEKFFPPIEPDKIRAQVLTRPPVVSDLNAFEVVNYKGTTNAHRYIQVDSSSIELPNGELQNPIETPFVFKTLGETTQFGYTPSPNGFPVYTRETTNAFKTPSLSEPTTTETISVKPLESAKSIDGFYPLFNSIEIASAVSEIDFAEQVVLNGVTYYQPSTFEEGWVYKGDHNGDLTNSQVFQANIRVAYDYNSPLYDENNDEITGIDFEFITSRLKPNENQVGRLGLKSYGGDLVSYYIDGFKVLPFTNDKVIQKPQTPPQNIEAEVMTLPNDPSNIDSEIFEWDLRNYSPSLWIDASQESEEFVNLTNHANTSHEVYPQNNPTTIASITQNNLPLYDFSSGLTCYNITGNVFGRSITNVGGEIEMFLVFQPLSYQNSHLFVNAGGTSQRFTCHAPHSGGQFIFDAGSANPARIQSSQNLQINNFYILSFVASNVLNELKLYVNGLETASKGYDLKLDTEFIRFGGWNNAPYSQQMYVAEMLFFKNKLELDKRQKVEGYLAHKWGLTNILDSNHPYKYKHPINLGEVVPLDPFVLPPYNLQVDQEPEAPSTPTAGLGTYKPSAVVAESYPNTPSLINAINIPYVTFEYDGTAISSKIFSWTIYEWTQTELFKYSHIDLTQNISGDAPQKDLQDFADLLVEKLVAKDKFGNSHNVTWSLQNVDANVTASISSTSGSNIESLSLSANRDFFHKETWKFEIVATDSQGRSNVLEILLRGRLQTFYSNGGYYPRGYIWSWIEPQNFNTEDIKKGGGYYDGMYNYDEYGLKPKTHYPRNYNRHTTKLVTGTIYRFKAFTKQYAQGMGASIQLRMPKGNLYTRTELWDDGARAIDYDFVRFDANNLVFEPNTIIDGETQIIAPPMYKIECTNITEIVAGGHYQFDFELTLYEGHMKFNAGSYTSKLANGGFTDFVAGALPNGGKEYFEHGDTNVTLDWWQFYPLFLNYIDVIRRRTLSLVFQPFEIKCNYNHISTSHVLTFNKLGEPSSVSTAPLKPQIPPSNITAHIHNPTWATEFDLELSPRKFYLDKADQSQFYIARDAWNYFRDGSLQPARTGEGVDWVWGFDFDYNLSKTRDLWVHYSELNNIEVLESGLTNAPNSFYLSHRNVPNESLRIYFDKDINPTFDLDTFKQLVRPWSVTTTSNSLILTLYPYKIRNDAQIKLPDETTILTTFGGYVQTTDHIRLDVFKVVNGQWLPQNKRATFFVGLNDLSRYMTIIEKNLSGQNVSIDLPQVMLPFVGKSSNALNNGYVKVSDYGTTEEPKGYDDLNAHISRMGLTHSYLNNDITTRGFFTHYHASLMSFTGDLQKEGYFDDASVNYGTNRIPPSAPVSFENPNAFNKHKDDTFHAFDFDEIIDWIETNSNLGVNSSSYTPNDDFWYKIRNSRISVDTRNGSANFGDKYNPVVSLPTNHYQCVEPDFENVQNDLGDDMGVAMTIVARGEPIPEVHQNWGVNKIKYFGGANVSSFPPVPPNWVFVGGEGTLIAKKDLPPQQTAPNRPLWSVRASWTPVFKDLVVFFDSASVSSPFHYFRNSPDPNWVGRYIYTTAQTSYYNGYLGAGVVARILQVNTYSPSGANNWSEIILRGESKGWEGKTGRIVIQGNESSTNNMTTLPFDGKIYSLFSN